MHIGRGVCEGFGPIRAARPRIERIGGKRCVLLHGRGKRKPVTETLFSKSPIAPSLSLFNVGGFLLRFNVPRCRAPHCDRTPGQGALRQGGGGLRRWLDAMRKKLDTRFPAPRIKKIMQADEDVGKIALAVPVLVSKALELFLQDLCDRTYDITIRKGVKTVSSYHLKQCIQKYNVYDFLREVVSKVPDISSPDANADDKFGKRKAAEDGSELELKRTRNESENHTSNGRGRGRARGRGRRGGRGAGKVFYMSHEKFYDQAIKPADLKLEVVDDVSDATEALEAKEGSRSRACLRNFDLNLDPTDEDEVTVPSQTQSAVLTTSSAAATAVPSALQLNEGTSTAGPSAPRSNEVPKLKDVLGWQLPEMNEMTMDPVQYALLSNPTLEEDEDYDNEE